jgi:hypothetical protein
MAAKGGEASGGAGLEAALEHSISTLWQCAVIVDEGDFKDPAASQQLVAKVKALLDSLRAVDAEGRLRHELVPTAVLEQVDAGRNPDLLIRDRLLAGQRSGDEMRGRVFDAHVIEQHLRGSLQTYAAAAAAAAAGAGTTAGAAVVAAPATKTSPPPS